MAKWWEYSFFHHLVHCWLCLLISDPNVYAKGHRMWIVWLPRFQYENKNLELRHKSIYKIKSPGSLCRSQKRIKLRDIPILFRLSIYYTLNWINYWTFNYFFVINFSSKIIAYNGISGYNVTHRWLFVLF